MAQKPHYIQNSKNCRSMSLPLTPFLPEKKCRELSIESYSRPSKKTR